MGLATISLSPVSLIAVERPAFMRDVLAVACEAWLA